MDQIMESLEDAAVRRRLQNEADALDAADERERLDRQEKRQRQELWRENQRQHSA